MDTTEIIRKLRFRADGEQSAKETRKLLTEAANRLEELDERVAIMSEDGWISVKDKLPEIQKGKQAILVCDANGNIHLTHSILTIATADRTLYFDETHEDCFWKKFVGEEPEIDTLIKGNEIRYWMPLSEPPEELTT